jgi:ubiquinone/menaquinone biosynthesis methyltransferase
MSKAKLDLKEHIASKEKKQQYVNWLFETIAPRYDFITVFLSCGMDRKWKRKLIELLAPDPSEVALDIACGTGDIAFALAQQLTAGLVIGLDITQNMLNIAESKRRLCRFDKVCFNRADIMRMPFADQTFDCVTAGYALRNIPDIEVALAEILRVLKPGGRFLSLDFGHPPNKLYRQVYLSYLSTVGSLLGLVLHSNPDTYRYIPETLKLYPGQRGVLELMQKVGFVNVGFHEFGGGIMAINYGTKPNSA